MKKIIPLTVLATVLLACSAFAAKKKISSVLEELFPGPLLDSKGTEVSKDNLAGKTIGIYFSAEWCPP